MRLVVRAGFVVGLALAAYGAMAYAWQAVAVAVFGLVACYQTDRQLAFSDSLLDFENDDYAIDEMTEDEADSDDVTSREDEHDRAATSARTEIEEAAILRPASASDEIDRILQKIADRGMASLDADERAVLQRETERKRRE